MLTIFLPSVSKRPLPSPELILDEEPGDQKVGAAGQSPRLLPWEMATLALNPGLALDLLVSLPNRPPRGVAFGSSLRFWVEAAKFSLELLTRQSFVPTLQEIQAEHPPQDDGVVACRAAWEAVLTEEDKERLRILSQAMPPICRAFTHANQKPGQPWDMAFHFLNQTVDAFVRGNLVSTSLLPSRPKGRSRVVPLPVRYRPG
jgi:hypothetical protein